LLLEPKPAQHRRELALHLRSVSELQKTSTCIVGQKMHSV
jgi:hypothetical protein